MKISLNLFWTILFSNWTIAQNLVPNPSFEDYIECPGVFSNIDAFDMAPSTLEYWSRPTWGSSDYFNSCAIEFTGGLSYTSVPFNFMGSQPAHSGDAYAGGSCFWTFASDYREYLQAPLTSPMVSGKVYFVSFNVALADNYESFLCDGIIGVDRLGIYFGADAENRATLECMDDLTPQIESPAGLMLTDMDNWTNISSHFEAIGGESWLIVGSFVPNDDLTYTVVQEGALLCSYYYYDDFCVLNLTDTENIFVRDTVLCLGDSFTFSARPDMDYYLTDKNTTSSSIDIVDTGTYWIASVDRKTCTTLKEVLHVKRPDSLVPANLGEDIKICADSSIVLTPGTYGTNVEYYWSTGSSDSIIEVAHPGYYHVTVTSTCNTTADTIHVARVPEPRLDLGLDIFECEGTQIRLGQPIEGSSYQWSTGDTTCCIDVQSSGIFTLYVENECGIQISDEISVFLADCDNCVWAPTAFSPNDDGLNDKFEIAINCPFKQYTLRIFDRWGRSVFTTHSPNTHWDGRVNGQPAEAGVYFYFIEGIPFIDKMGKISHKGDITLIR
jgi:gliding motility-associated-like protein